MNTAIERETCASDFYCCTQGWDAACHVVAVFDGNCSVPLGDRTEDCCTSHKSTGCDNVTVSQDVCFDDPYCCTVAWDETCAAFADFHGADCQQSTDCCTVHPEAKCSDGVVSACVVGNDAFCGSNAWDTRCVLLADTACSAGCTDPPAGTQACCTASTTGAQGCNDQAIQNCVCLQDPYCCDVEWDAQCVKRVGANGCGRCSGGSGTGSCCAGKETPGCNSISGAADCVCDHASGDEFCCDTAWDTTCANLVDSLGCGSCGTVPPATNTCCDASAQRGCLTASIQSCVCAVDPFCCDTAWDGECVRQINLNNCDSGEVCTLINTNGCCDVGQNGRVRCADSAVADCVCAQDAYCCGVEWDAGCAAEVTTFGCGAGGGVSFEAGTLEATIGNPGGAKNVAWGQSVEFPIASKLTEMAFEFATGFGGSQVDVKFNVFTIDGNNKLRNEKVTVPASFSGGWVTWTGVSKKSLDAGTYVITAFVSNGLSNGAQSQIKYADNGPGTPGGSAYEFTQTSGGEKFHKWTGPPGWQAVPAKDLNYRVKFQSAPDIDFEAGTLTQDFGGNAAPVDSQTGWGQSIILTSSLTFDNVAFQFGTGFGSSNQDVYLDIYDSSQTRLAHETLTFSKSFIGGWAAWNVALTLTPGTYFFRVYVDQVFDDNAFATIIYANASASTPTGDAYTATATSAAQYTMDTWAGPPTWNVDTAKDLNYRLIDDPYCQ